MAFATLPHSQGTSPSTQESDSLAPSAEKRPPNFFDAIRSWLMITKRKKDELSEGVLFAGSRSEQSRKRDDDSDQSMDNRRHSSTDNFECHSVEQDVTTFQVCLKS